MADEKLEAKKKDTQGGNSVWARVMEAAAQSIGREGNDGVSKVSMSARSRKRQYKRMSASDNPGAL